MLYLVFLLGLCSLPLSHGFQCLRCRRFWPNGTAESDPPSLVWNHLATDVPSCAATAEECDHSKCYSLTYTNATTGVRGEVRDCLGKALGYWTEGQVTGGMVDRGAEEGSVDNWYTCDTENCNMRQDEWICNNATDPNSTYTLVNETADPCSHGSTKESVSGAETNQLLGLLVVIHVCTLLAMNRV